MAWFLCNYPAWPKEPSLKAPIGNYSSFIWARNLQEAKRLAKRRRIGERVMWERGNRGQPYIPPSKQMRKRHLTPKQRLNVIHAVCFLSYLASRAMKMGPEDTMGDEGFLHQTVHSLSIGFPRRRQMIAYLEEIERRVPGYLKPGKKKGR